MNITQRVAVGVTVVNLALLVILLTQRGPAMAQSTSPQEDVSVLRVRGLELVDAAGKVRGQFTVEDDGEAVFRIRDASGAIRVKLGAGSGGSGLLLLDETTEPGVQIIARRVAAGERKTTTSVNLTGAGGQRRAITP